MLCVYAKRQMNYCVPVLRAVVSRKKGFHMHTPLHPRPCFLVGKALVDVNQKTGYLAVPLC